MRNCAADGQGLGDLISLRMKRNQKKAWLVGLFLGASALSFSQSLAPTLTSISPNVGAQGATVPVTLTGTNFFSGDSVTVTNESVTVTNVNVVSSTQITATFNIASTAPLGPSSVFVSSQSGSSGPAGFTVVAAVPVLSFVNPGSGAVGTGVSVTLVGANFVSGATVNLSSTDVTAGNVNVVSSTQITAVFAISATAAFGPVNVSVTTGGGTSGTVAFNVTPPPPTLSSIVPGSGPQGATVPVTLTGTNFVSGASVGVGSSNITVSNVSVVSSTQITATFSIASAAPVGSSTVTVSTSGGTSLPVTFGITSAAAPILTSINPANGSVGATVPVTLTGSNFLSGATVSINNAGVTISSVTVVSATQITATFAIAPTASTGPANVSVTTSNGTSGTVTFTVASQVPTLSAITPNTGSQGASVPVTLTGTGFLAGATVNVSGTGVTVSNVSVASATQITASFAVAAAAPLGPMNVSVTTSNGTSGTVPFTVVAPGPTLTSISPSNGSQGLSVPVTLTGTNFLSGATISITNPGVTVTNLNVASATQIAATFVIAANAAPGAANVTVSDSAGTSGAVTFTILTPGPNLFSISPATGAQGSSVPVTLTGSGFAAGATVGVSNPGVTVSNVTLVSATQITATFAIALNASAGAANVTVTLSGSTTGAVTFTVTATVLPTVSIAGGEGSTVNPLGTKTFSVVLPAAAPTTASGTLALQFTSDAVNQVSSDPEVQFVNGTTPVTTVSFTFPAGQTQALLSPANATVQTGTVAGTVSVLIGSYQGGTPPNPIIGTLKVARTSPQITSIKLANKTATGFDVCVAGFSATRDVTAVSYQFTGSGQGTLQTTQLPAGSDLTGKFTTWFQGANSVPTGGQFLLDQTFTVSGPDTAIGSITVTLQNTTGANTSTSVPYSGFAASCN